MVLLVSRPQGLFSSPNVVKSSRVNFGPLHSFCSVPCALYLARRRARETLSAQKPMMVMMLGVEWEFSSELRIGRLGASEADRHRAKTPHQPQLKKKSCRDNV